MIKIATIIPYYQRKPGILRRALQSVLEQKLPADVEVTIIVVDDGSPIAAKTEIEGLSFVSPYRLKLVETTNGGVAAARNVGLDNVPADSDFAAFLDSDDLWGPSHLSTALSALVDDYDFYFSDHTRIGGHESFFRMRNFTPHALPHPAGGSLRGIDKDEFAEALLRFAISHMSTTVFRWSRAADARFDAKFYLAGEDVIYLMTVAQKCRRFCYTPDILVTCADGVNIWASRYDWDAPTHMASQLCRLMTMQEIKKNIPLAERSRHFVGDVITQLRRYIAFMSIRELVKRKRLWPENVTAMRRHDPSFWRWYPLCVIYVMLFYPLRLYTPQD